MKINTGSKNFRTILFSLIGLAVLAAIVLILMLTAPQDDESEEQTAANTVVDDSALILLTEDKGEIESIHIENPDADYTIKKSVNKSDESVWTIEGYENVKESLWVQSSFESLVNSFNEMKARSVVEENPSDIAQYGLDSPLARAVVKYENGESFTLLVGGNVMSGSANYIMTSNSDSVYSYYTSSLSAVMNNDPMSYIDKTVTPSFDSSNTPDVKKITVSRKDWEQPLVLEALPEPENEESVQIYSHTFTSPYNLYLDFERGNEYLNAMFGLAAEKAVYVDPTEQQLEETGLDDPFCEVDIIAVNEQAEGEEEKNMVFRLFVGDPVTEEVTDEKTGVTTNQLKGFYAISNQVKNVIYYFNADSLVWATMEPDEYISKFLLMPYIYDLDTVAYRDNECEFTVRVEGGAKDMTVMLDGKESDPEHFRSFYQYLIDCRGEEIYIGEEKGDFIAEFSYTYDDGREKDTITLYESDDRKIIIALNGKNVFKAKRNYTLRLLENAQAYLGGEEIIMNF